MKNIFKIVCCFLFVFSSLEGNAQSLLTHQKPLPCLNKKFTIVAHIVRDTFGAPGILEDDILVNVEELNTYFEPICVAFEVCDFNYVDNFQYDNLDGDDWNELIIKYHRANRINMFFSADPTEDEICGFAAGTVVDGDNSGIMIFKDDCASATTFGHEMGHYFGLPHTFLGSGDELVNGSNCETAGDSICDTPADPYVVGDNMDAYLDGCRFISQKVDANGEYYVPDVGNIMSYYPCTCGFTYEQYLRMAETCRNATGIW